MLADEAVPWAKPGLARVRVAAGQAGQAGQVGQAVATIQNLLADGPRDADADAGDVIGRNHAEQGVLAGAIAADRQAVEIPPFSVARAQASGILAWCAAGPDVALAAPQHAWRSACLSHLLTHQAGGRPAGRLNLPAGRGSPGRRQVLAPA